MGQTATQIVEADLGNRPDGAIPSGAQRKNHLRALEAESIYILR